MRKPNLLWAVPLITLVACTLPLANSLSMKQMLAVRNIMKSSPSVEQPNRTTPLAQCGVSPAALLSLEPEVEGRLVYLLERWIVQGLSASDIKGYLSAVSSDDHLRCLLYVGDLGVAPASIVAANPDHLMSACSTLEGLTENFPYFEVAGIEFDTLKTILQGYKGGRMTWQAAKAMDDNLQTSLTEDSVRASLFVGGQYFVRNNGLINAQRGAPEDAHLYRVMSSITHHYGSRYVDDYTCASPNDRRQCVDVLTMPDSPNCQTCLNAGEAAVFKSYSEEGTHPFYAKVNNLLRGLRPCDPSKVFTLFLNTVTLDVGLSKLPKYKGTTYRGLQLKPNIGRRFTKVGSTISLRDFASTSKFRNRAFSGNHLWVMKSRSGRQISAFSRYASEAEVLFRPGTRFVITKVLRKGEAAAFDDLKRRSYVVFMDEITSSGPVPHSDITVGANLVAKCASADVPAAIPSHEDSSAALRKSRLSSDSLPAPQREGGDQIRANEGSSSAERADEGSSSAEAVVDPGVGQRHALGVDKAVGGHDMGPRQALEFEVDCEDIPDAAIVDSRSGEAGSTGSGVDSSSSGIDSSDSGVGRRLPPQSFEEPELVIDDSLPSGGKSNYALVKKFQSANKAELLEHKRTKTKAIFKKFDFPGSDEGASALAHYITGGLVVRVERSGSYVAQRAIDNSGDVLKIVKSGFRGLSTTQVHQLVVHMISDWVISNYDAHSGNFLIANDASHSIVGIDKGQAFKFLSPKSGKFSSKFKDRFTEPRRLTPAKYWTPAPHDRTVYKPFWDLVKSGKISVSLAHPLVVRALGRCETLTLGALKGEDGEAGWLTDFVERAFSQSGTFEPRNERDAFYEEVLRRAHSVRRDLEAIMPHGRRS